MQVAVLGIDLGKNSCSVVGLGASGRIVLRRRMRRDGVVALAAGLQGCRPAWWRWRPAAARTILAGSCRAKGTRFG